MDQILLLDCLINKKMRDDNSAAEFVSGGDNRNVDVIQTSKQPTPERNFNQNSLMSAINQLPRDGTNSLLLAVLTHTLRVPVAWSFVPSTLQPNASDRKSVV